LRLRLYLRLGFRIRFGFRIGPRERLGFLCRLRLQQPVQRELIVLFLIALAMRFRTEFAAAGPSLEEGQLLPAVQTPHVALIDPFMPMLKSLLTRFHAVKHLSPGFQGKTLGGIKRNRPVPSANMARSYSKHWSCPHK